MPRGNVENHVPSHIDRHPFHALRHRRHCCSYVVCYLVSGVADGGSGGGGIVFVVFRAMVVSGSYIFRYRMILFFVSLLLIDGGCGVCRRS